MKTITVDFPIGHKVIVGDDINAVVTAITIRGEDYASYECSYIYNGIYYSNFFTKDEIKTKPKKVKVGFEK